jgi:hypothetical protein
VFDVKHDGCHKARYVAGGHLTDVPNVSVYSGVVFLQGLRANGCLSIRTQWSRPMGYQHW